MSTVIDFKSLVQSVESRVPPVKDMAYSFSNGREFERPADPYRRSDPNDSFPFTFPITLE